jgi:hypothetical protein
MRTVLTDDTTYARLVRETAQHPRRSWDGYADDLWQFLVESRPPGLTVDGRPQPE